MSNFKLYKPNLTDFIDEAQKEGVKLAYITNTSRIQQQLMMATYLVHVTCFLPGRSEPMILLLETGRGFEHQKKENWDQMEKVHDSVVEKLTAAGIKVRKGVISDEPVPGNLSGILPKPETATTEKKEA
jgi:hypothetical protein